MLCVFHEKNCRTQRQNNPLVRSASLRNRAQLCSFTKSKILGNYGMFVVMAMLVSYRELLNHVMPPGICNQSAAQHASSTPEIEFDLYKFLKLRKVTNKTDWFTAEAKTGTWQVNCWEKRWFSCCLKEVKKLQNLLEDIKFDELRKQFDMYSIGV